MLQLLRGQSEPVQQVSCLGEAHIPDEYSLGLQSSGDILYHACLHLADRIELVRQSFLRSQDRSGSG
jgi:hypothetical protein